MVDLEAGVPGGERRPGVVVVGGGITGLAAAHRLTEIAPRIRVAVLDAQPQPGGVLQTVRKDGFLIESSADSFITAVPWGLTLCRRLGLQDEIIETDRTHRRAFVVYRGRLAPIPDGLMVMAPSRVWPMLSTPILSLRSKLRMAWEPFVPPGTEADESMASFVVRRLGREAYDRLIQPLVGGIYTADPERLSLKATMPRFLEMERKHGSLLRATLFGAKPKGDGSGGSGARYSLFVGLREGMSSLVETLVKRLPAGTLRSGTHVERLEHMADGRWIVNCGPERIDADAVIVATPVRSAARLLTTAVPDLAARLDRISSTSCAIVSLGYRRDQIAHPLDGFGFVVPVVEQRAILSGSFSSVKFAGRSPEDGALIRVFVGGAARPELVERPADELVNLASRELASLLGIRGEPEVSHISRWPQVMPQYEVGHVERVAEIESLVAQTPGLEVAGNAFHGVGVPYCIHSGEQAAERVAAALGGS